MIRNNKNQTNQNKIWPGSVSKICPLKLTGTKNLMTINLLSAANLSPIPYHKFDLGGQSKHFGFWLLQQYLTILITYKKICICFIFYHIPYHYVWTTSWIVWWDDEVLILQFWETKESHQAKWIFWRKCFLEDCKTTLLNLNDGCDQAKDIPWLVQSKRLAEGNKSWK